MTATGPASVAPAEGKLGVLCVGLGAVTSTLIAGVELARRGLGEPIGSLTQLGTIRLGTRTENRVPLIRDFVSLAGLDDLVFGALGRLSGRCLRVRVPSRGARRRSASRGDRRRAARGAPDAGRVRPGVREAPGRSQRQGRDPQAGDARGHPGRHRELPERAPRGPARDDLVRVDRDLHRARPRARRHRGLRAGHRRRRSRRSHPRCSTRTPRCRRDPVRQRCAQPHRRRPGAA